MGTILNLLSLFSSLGPPPVFVYLLFRFSRSYDAQLTHIMNESTFQLDPSLLEAQEKETALDWLKRAQKNRRNLNQNPISFPPFFSSFISNDEFDNITSETSTSSFDRFIVSPQNILNMSAQTWLSDFSSLNHIIARSRRWRQRKQVDTNDRDCLVALEESLLQSFPHGCGVAFVDKFLSTDWSQKTIHDRKKSCGGAQNVFLELTGLCRSVLTKICTTMATSYAASTSIRCYGIGIQGISPPIIVIDPECTFSLDKLIASVKTEVLRRWNTTDTFRRQLKFKYDTLDSENEKHLWSNADNEYKNIEEDVNSVLERIHIMRPRDLHGYVSILESLFHFLELRKKNRGAHPAAPMIIMASTMSAFSLTTKFQESLPDGSGLSGRSDFIRSLSRLRSNHNVVIVSTRISNTDAQNFNPSGYERYDKLVTHQISISKCLPGSNESHQGFDFVANCACPGEMKPKLSMPFTVENCT
jgi:hypothetical protein